MKSMTPSTNRAKNKEQSTLIITGYTDRLVIQKRALADPTKASGKWHTVSKLELTEKQTDDLLVMLPQAVLVRERRKNSKTRKGFYCVSGDI
jgi:hypothetical protein